MPMAVKNIFAELPNGKNGEQLLTLFEAATLRIERIFSQCHSSAEGFWYDQTEDEWVMVLRGDATLEFAAGELLELKEGDYVAIPRRVKHRVSRTGPATIWLAVHLK